MTSPIDMQDSSGAMSAANGLHRVVKKLTTDVQTKTSPSSAAQAFPSNASQFSMTSPDAPPQLSFPTNYVPEPTVHDDRAAMDLAYGNLGNLFEWDSQTPRFGAFPMEVSGATNLGMNPQMSVNFDNVELENMLASFMPSRPPSPHQHQVVGPDFTNRLNDYNGDPNHAVWPSVDRSQDMPNQFGTPYNGWMG